MKFLIVAVADFPQGFATAERIRLIAKTLRSGGHEAELALIHSGRHRAVTPADATVAGQHDGTRYRYLNGRSFRPEAVWSKALDTLRGAFCTAAHIRTQHRAGNLDAVIFYTPNFLKILPALLMAKWYRLGCFFELCEIGTSSGNDAALSRVRRLASIGDWLTERLAPRLADGLIIISSRIMAYYADRLPVEKMFYLPALADGAEFDLALNTPVEVLAEKRFVLSSGSFAQKEGIPFIIEAFGQVASTFPDLHLVFTGNPGQEQRELFAGIARRHGCEERLIFTGYLSRSELIWCYQNAMALLACRTASEFAQFGFPTKLVDYMLSGRPILATSVGAISETLHDGETAYLAEPENVASIAAALRKIMENPSLAASVANNAYTLASESFDYRCHAAALSGFVSGKKSRQ
ncbi:MAG: glycosyltransferase [Pseudomonadales bacterium]|nr:glycosyltransferase [Pseudomonadales bacterium]